jgi:hypothetical protein
MPAGVQATKRGALLDQQHHVRGVEAVHVLLRVQAPERARGVDLRRMRQLHEDLVDLGRALKPEMLSSTASVPA